MSRARLLLATACLAAIAAAALDPGRFLRSWLFAWLVWAGVATGCLGVLLLWHMVGGAWGSVIRRPLEAGAVTIPWLAVLFAPIALGLDRIYPWVARRDAPAAADAFHDAWLSRTAFLIRAGVYLACWTFMALRLRRLSREEDATGSPDPAVRSKRFAGPAFVVFGLTGTFAAVDWSMSLEPDFSSGAYGVIALAGHGVVALAFAILVLVALSRRAEVGRRMKPQHFHDLGNLLLAFVMLWAYVQFGQYLIVWSGHLPDEMRWLARRTQGGWQWIAWTLLVLGFAAPFLALLVRDLKRKAPALAAVAALVATLRVVEQYWLVDPAFDPGRLRLHVLDFVLLAAIGAAWLTAFAAALRAMPPLPLTFDAAEKGLAHE